MTLATEDKLETLELCARYNYAFDNEDAEAWAATFTEDGVFGSHKGTEELRAFVPRRRERMRKEDTLKEVNGAWKFVHHEFIPDE